MSKQQITVLGAGISGLWQALLLAHHGHEVTLIEKSQTPFSQSASQYAGAMLAPHVEAETGGPIIERFGLEALELWKAHYPAFTQNGSLVLARPRETNELKQFARKTNGHQTITAERINELEPDLAGHYDVALYYEKETHLDPNHALPFLMNLAKRAGVEVVLGKKVTDIPCNTGWLIDCTGMGAADQLRNLRGIRGERLILRSSEITLNRAIHLLHPRFPVYVVPWPMGTFMVGATMIETTSEAPISVRSALELLSAAYSLHPAFAEAQILSFDVGVRPAFPDNLPKIVVKDRTLYVNGLCRNGFLLAPILADLTRRYIETGETNQEIFVEDYFKR